VAQLGDEGGSDCARNDGKYESNATLAETVGIHMQLFPRPSRVAMVNLATHPVGVVNKEGVQS
jgi:hypothetical protein